MWMYVETLNGNYVELPVRKMKRICAEASVDISGNKVLLLDWIVNWVVAILL